MVGKFFLHASVRTWRIASCSMRDDECRVVIDLAVLHSQRVEYPLLHKCGEWLTAYLFDDFGQQHVVGIAIGPLRSWSELQFVWLEGGVDRLVACEVVEGDPWLSAVSRQIGVLVQPAGHVDEMLDAQIVTVLCSLGDVFGDGVFERELAVEDEKCDCSACELLGY